MTKDEKRKLISIYNKMIADGTHDVDLGFLGIKKAYLLTTEEYDFIKPFLRFWCEKKYTFEGGLEFSQTSSDGIVILTTDGDDIGICPNDEEYMLKLREILEMVLMFKKPYKAYCMADGGDSE